MVNINILVVRELEDRMDVVERVIQDMNFKYQEAGVPITIHAQSLDEKLRQHPKIEPLKKLDFSAGLKENGIEQRDEGQWYKNGEPMSEVTLDGMEPDPKNYRFNVSDDEIEREYVLDEKKRLQNENIRRVKFRKLPKLEFIPPNREEIDKKIIETKDNFYNGIGKYPHKNHIWKIAHSINKIENKAERREHFELLPKVLATMRYNGELWRISPAPDYEDCVSHYPNVKALQNSINSTEEKNFILLDNYNSEIELGDFERPYMYFRHPNKPSYGSVGDYFESKAIEFVLLHELCHLTVDINNDVDSPNTDDNTQLMCAPLSYRRFNPEKLSVESIREAYAKLIEK